MTEKARRMIVTQIPRWLVAVGATGMLLLAAGGMMPAQAEEQDQTAESADGAASSEPGDYTVVDGKVDQGTYDGYIAYTRSCMACHGPDGLGSSFAPSLMKKSQSRTFAEFARTIAAGMEIQPGRVMPSFADDEYVLSNIENIYSYMKARAAGDIGRGRPKVIGEEQDSDDGN
ncbi:c-type cytochrome [Litchfieldella rifensis]|uniref:C-type cytochrome n=1 Tax=Litchfieldella rifensis TaxID=762643 RepID=A0ABV7LKH3_9GAMM